jgi:hypothetical protein
MLDEILKVAITEIYLMVPYCGNEIMFMVGHENFIFLTNGKRHCIQFKFWL